MDAGIRCSSQTKITGAPIGGRFKKTEASESPILAELVMENWLWRC